jgi:endonuclease YncB( thermonuclease family)
VAVRKAPAAMRIVLAFTFFILTFNSTLFADVTGKPRIIDGDTVEIAGERIRLNGIDTPEAKQTCLDGTGNRWRCGREATLALTTIVGDQEIICKGDERDKYKRLIAVCFAGTKDLNAEMVRQGWALAYRKYSTDYVAEEADAKAKKLGLWRGQFVAPWDWRRGKRLATEVQKTCCKICRKGKACGNSCIRRTYTCRKGPGCACDAK